MGRESNLFSINIGDASGALSQFTLVRHNGTNVVQAGAGLHGWSLQEPTTAAGDQSSVMTYGRTKVTAGAAVAIGDTLASNAAGLVVPAATGNQVVGRALSAASATGQIIDMIVEPVGGAQLN